jgi:hypothetical protein
MVDVVLTSDDLSILGGPASIDVNIGVGQQGLRGTYIFTGFGKPTDPGIVFLDNYDQKTKEVQAKDLYINLKPSDIEYLYLYQYEPTITGTYQWVKVLRLVPNTAIANSPVIFYNGQAVTFRSTQGLTTTAANEFLSSIDLSTIIPSPIAPAPVTDGMLWLDISNAIWTLKVYVAILSSWVEQGTVTPGLFFPLALYFPLSDLGTLSSTSFNIQYTIVNEKAIASGITVGEITEIGTDVLLPIYVNATESTINPMTGDVTWEAVTGIKTVHILMTAGVN